MANYNEIYSKEHDGSSEVKGKRSFLYGWDYNALNPVKLRVNASGDVVIDQTPLDAAYLKLDGSNANTTIDIGSQDFRTTGQIFSGLHTLVTDGAGFGFSIEENTGGEIWQVGVDVDGDLNFFNSSVLAVQFLDTGEIVTSNGTILADATANGTLILGNVGGTFNTNISIDFDQATSNPVLDSPSGASALRFDIGLHLIDGVPFMFGSGQDVKFQWATTGNDNLQIGTGVNSPFASGYISIMEKGDLSDATRSPSSNSINPVLRIYSSDATQALDYIEFYHNQTDGVIFSGTGTTSFLNNDIKSTGNLDLIGTILTDDFTDLSQWTVVGNWVIDAGTAKSIGAAGTHTLTANPDLGIVSGARYKLTVTVTSTVRNATASIGGDTQQIQIGTNTYFFTAINTDNLVIEATGPAVPAFFVTIDDLTLVKTGVLTSGEVITDFLSVDEATIGEVITPLITNSGNIAIQSDGDASNYFNFKIVDGFLPTIQTVTSSSGMAIASTVANSAFYYLLDSTEDLGFAVVVSHGGLTNGGGIFAIGMPGIIYSDQEIRIKAGGDLDDYIEISTTANQTTLNFVGQDGLITSDLGTINFTGTNITTDQIITGQVVIADDGNFRATLVDTGMAGQFTDLIGGTVVDILNGSEALNVAFGSMTISHTGEIFNDTQIETMVLLTDEIQSIDATSVFDLGGAGGGSIDMLVDLNMGLSNILFAGTIQTTDLWADNYYDSSGNSQWGSTDGIGNFTFDGTVTIAQVLTTTAITLELDTVDIIGGSFLSSVDWGSATWTTLGNVGIGQAAGTEKLEITDLRPNILLTNNENANGFVIGFPNAAAGEPALSTILAGGSAGRIFQRQGGSNDVFIGDIDNTGGGVKIRTSGTDRLEITDAGIFDFKTYQLNTTSDLSSFGKTAFKSSSGTPNVAINVIENSGTEDFQLGVDASGQLQFYNSSGTVPAMTILDTAGGERTFEVGRGETWLVGRSGGYINGGYKFKGTGGTDLGGFQIHGSSDAVTKYFFSNNSSGISSSTRIEFLNGTANTFKIYGGQPSIEQHVERGFGGITVDAIQHWFKQTGQTDTKVMVFGTHGDATSPTSTADYIYMGVGAGVDVTTAAHMFGFNGGISMNAGNGVPANLIEGFQFADDNGYKLFGFDNESAEFIHIYNDSVGDQNIECTGILNIKNDVLFVGSGTGLAYGEIWAEDNAVETVISVAGTFVQVTTFDTNGENNNTTPDHTNDHITVLKAGRYMINVSVVIESAAGTSNVVHLHVAKNNNAVQFGNIHAHRSMAGGGGDRGSISMSGIVSLAANDTVELWVTNDTNTNNYIVEDVTLSLTQIGG